MTGFQKGARPIKSQTIRRHYQRYHTVDMTLEQYIERWRSWITFSNQKTLLGLDNFVYADYTQGTSQSFDQFVLHHAKHRILAAFNGEFQYHACITKHLDFSWLSSVQDITSQHALIISAPFSDLGCLLPEFDIVLQKCNTLNVPVCLDLAYWGISKNIQIDLDRYPCIEQVTCSLSKPFYVLENHRVGIRFSRDYLNDGISMINEVGMQNIHSMSLGVYFMDHFSCDWNWNRFGDRYHRICQEYDIRKTDTVIFGTSSCDQYSEFSRGMLNNYRLCIGHLLSDLSAE